METYNFNPFPELRSDRIRLRQVVMTDVQAIRDLRDHPKNSTYLVRPEGYTLEDAAKKIEVVQQNAETGVAIFWVICLLDDPTILGTICLWHLEPENDRGEVGYETHPDHWRKGYMREALGLVMDYAFGTMKIHTICAFTDAENIASIRLLERAGFEKEGHFRDAVRFPDGYHDQVVYAKVAE